MEPLDAHKLESLPYRELQGLAKKRGIPANKKKEVLIKLLLEKNKNGDEGLDKPGLVRIFSNVVN